MMTIKNIRESDYNIHLKGENKLIVWNTLSDKMQILEKNSFLYNYYINSESTCESIPGENYYVLHAQVLNGFLRNCKKEEISEVESKLISKRHSNSLSAVITSTFSCNFNCSYCCQGTEKESGGFDYNVCSKLTNLWKESGKSNLNVTWYGGEPLLFANKVFDESAKIKHIVRKSGGTYKAQIYTNGYLLTPSIAKKMIESGITKVQVSIDGTKDTHDQSRFHRSGKPTFNKIFENIKNALKGNHEQLEFTIRINIEADKVDISELIFDLLSVKAHQLENTSFYLAPIEKRVGTSESVKAIELITKERFSEFYRQFISESKNHKISYFIPNFTYGSCTATREHAFVLAPNGDVHRCWDTVVIPTESLASIHSDSSILKNIVAQNDKWQNFRASKHPKCAKCKLLPVCGGSCAIKHFTQNESSDNDANFHLACPPNKFLLKEYILDVLGNNSIDVDKTVQTTLSDGEFIDISLDSLTIKCDEQKQTVKRL